MFIAAPVFRLAAEICLKKMAGGSWHIWPVVTQNPPRLSNITPPQLVLGGPETLRGAVKTRLAAVAVTFNHHITLEV